jgi:hypothetical protein
LRGIAADAASGEHERSKKQADLGAHIDDLGFTGRRIEIS